MPTVQQLVRRGRAQKSQEVEGARPRPAARSAAACASASSPRRRRSRTRRCARSRACGSPTARGDRLHPGRRSQAAGALRGARARRPREGSAGRPLPHRARHARLDRRRRPPPEPLEVRRQATRSSIPAAAPGHPSAAVAVSRETDAPTSTKSPSASPSPDPKFDDRMLGALHERDDARRQEEHRGAHPLRRLRRDREQDAQRPDRRCSAARSTT